MYLTKLFIIFGAVLIATLGQTEGRRLWLKRTGENVGCAGRKQLNFTIGSVSDKNNINLVQEPRNGTELNNRRSGKWHKLKCGKTNYTEEVSNIELKVNSSDSDVTQDNAKLHRNSKISRRMNCSEKRMFNRTANSSAALNVTHNELSLSDNGEGQNFRRHQKCKGRFGHRGKCNKSKSQVSRGKILDSNENLLINEDSSTIEEPKPNIN